MLPEKQKTTPPTTTKTTTSTVFPNKTVKSTEKKAKAKEERTLSSKNTLRTSCSVDIVQNKDDEEQQQIKCKRKGKNNCCSYGDSRPTPVRALFELIEYIEYMACSSYGIYLPFIIRALAHKLASQPTNQKKGQEEGEKNTQCTQLFSAQIHIFTVIGNDCSARLLSEDSDKI